MNYPDALAYLDSFVNFERAAPTVAQRKAYDLTRVHELAARLGDPQHRVPVLHVAGTKGKGSTCAFAAAILRAAGLRVGLYTSPHLRHVRERIRVDGEDIPEADFAARLSEMQPVLEEMRARPEGSRRPTYFEILTHLAFVHFAQRQVDVAVIEVGLGGRLDATNIVHPALCAITNISHDHTAILGDTLALIATEKAGICKPGVLTLSAPQVPEALAAIETRAQAVGAPLEVLGRDFFLKAESSSADTPVALLSRDGKTLARARLGLRGSFQRENWALAACMAGLFFERTRGHALPADAFENGSRTVDWPGRLEELPRNSGGPVRCLDGAHNRHSVEVVLRELDMLYPLARPRCVLFACARDKAVDEMLNLLAGWTDEIVFTFAHNPRGCTPQELAARWNAGPGRGKPVHMHDQPAEGWSHAEKIAVPHGLVLAIGSLYLVGTIKDLP